MFTINQAFKNNKKIKRMENHNMNEYLNKKQVSN